ncbi:signal peptidase I [Candidatus Roizmanbacteria bacterium RIFCSPHIGHO2_02_FULL_40_9]|uniref:Signal peptidase I n=2 Tax=Candidatus Roizmaniibacteriota TaxID=1752723 RepID=A0A1F7IND5_9BACT|nr:MAG: signal peptidase I [Candidatus Roizmanbacteria bacterium RIFCSPHIGHO2_02_FULL_40_9]OGK44905.1 MAG: signal peptidase I [Candidatus Roizmanbacteria bacterium RIFCSPLOWO2_01_FULL_38_11]
MDILETVTFVGSLFIVVYFFVMQPHLVKGSSMDDSFHNGQYILTNKLAYRFGHLSRGDVIVFESPENKDIDFIKRIIGLPGDRIKIENRDVFVNGIALKEYYIKDKTDVYENGFMREGEEIVVPKNEIFVLGDNRPRSSDSRIFGPIPVQGVIGKVFFRYFPADKVGTIKNPYQSSLSLSFVIS